MPFKILAGVVAVALMCAFLLPPVVKLKDVALGVVICIGFGMMLADLLQSLKSKDD
jgi:di/tricarboxylate transporter